MEWDKWECEWNSVLVFTTFTLPFLTGMILKDVNMSPERCCVSELEKVVGLELHKNILEHEKLFFEVLIN